MDPSLHVSTKGMDKWPSFHVHHTVLQSIYLMVYVDFSTWHKFHTGAGA